MGAGKQILSWIHIDDWIRAVGKCIDDASVRGPVNLTAPHPARSSDFAATLGKVLHRPAVIAVPSIVLELGVGKDIAQELLLTGARILPSRLEQAGFEFRYAHLEAALSAICRGTQDDADKKSL